MNLIMIANHSHKDNKLLRIKFIKDIKFKINLMIKVLLIKIKILN